MFSGSTLLPSSLMLHFLQWCRTNTVCCKQSALKKASRRSSVKPDGDVCARINVEKSESRGQEHLKTDY
jgi:hypothetical protein